MDQVEFTEILDHSVKTDRTGQAVSKYLIGIVKCNIAIFYQKSFPESWLQTLNISKDQGLLNGSLSPKFKEKWSLRSHSNDYL